MVLYLGCRSASPRGIYRNTDPRIPPPEILIVPGCNPSITHSGLPTKTLFLFNGEKIKEEKQQPLRPFFSARIDNH